ncbi:MAG: hypothetical protein QOE89_506, partial [Pseudonocardiales bacterium]|nr:hypothetical protein [Pseudonocardiales bacterium]
MLAPRGPDLTRTPLQVLTSDLRRTRLETPFLSQNFLHESCKD